MYMHRSDRTVPTGLQPSIGDICEELRKTHPGKTGSLLSFWNARNLLSGAQESGSPECKKIAVRNAKNWKSGTQKFCHNNTDINKTDKNDTDRSKSRSSEKESTCLYGRFGNVRLSVKKTGSCGNCIRMTSRG